MPEHALMNPCACFTNAFHQDVPEHLRLLSSIPNQKIYRCQRCHAFLAYQDQRQSWEVLLPGTGDRKSKSLF